MPFRETYQQQVALLLRAMPAITGHKDFALKGGTAINLFVRNMPRLSVDIDLTYLPVASREQSLAAIDAGMDAIAVQLTKAIPGIAITANRLSAADNITTRLLVRSPNALLKIEVTPVLRGCVYDPQLRSVTPTVEENFGFAEAQIVSFPDLYAGKIVAALDRQHPRDLFDVRELLADEGISDELRKAFVVYLISHNRPMHEVLAPTLKNVEQAYQNEFDGMTAEPVPLAELYTARDALLADVVGQMPDEHQQFLIGFEDGAPDWALLGLRNVDRLPAVRWRQHNLDTRTGEQRSALVENLKRAFAKHTG